MEVIMSNPSAFLIHLIKKMNKVYIFWKSGSLYVAILATLISIVITRILIMILNRHRRDRTAASSVAATSALFDDDDDDFSDLDDDDDEFNNADDDDGSESSIEEGEGQTETRESESTEEVKSKLQRGFSWTDFAKGRSVVKLWDGIGLGLDLNQSSSSLISIYDLDRERRITSIFDKCKSPSTLVRPSPPSSSVVISTSRRSFSSWDSRMGAPSIVAEWDDDEVGPSTVENRAAAPGMVFRGVKKVYVGDSVSGVVTVADARKVGRVVERWKESE